MQTKKCKKCNVIKSIVDFSPCKLGKDGIRSDCRLCHNAYCRNLTGAELVRAKEVKREWNIANKNRRAENGRKWNAANPGRQADAAKKWCSAHRDRLNRQRRERYTLNPEIGREYARKYGSTQMGMLNRRMSTGIRKSLKDGSKAGCHWESLVDYKIVQLKKHLEKLFKLGMTWENYGQWHIDHKIPKSVFNYEKPEHFDFKRCWALSNLQPMWAKENISKHDKIDKPFQPALAL